MSNLEIEYIIAEDSASYTDFYDYWTTKAQDGIETSKGAILKEYDKTSQKYIYTAKNKKQYYVKIDRNSNIKVLDGLDSESEANDLKAIKKVMEVNDEIYVQHKEPDENGYIYDKYILESEGEETTVWEVMTIDFNGLNKYWTSQGDYVDESELYQYGGNYTSKVMSTTPDEYIDVVEGEEYFVRMYGEQKIYQSKWVETVPIVFLNENNEAVGYALKGSYSASKKGVTFTVPQGATKMHITNYCNQDSCFQKKVVLSSEKFNEIKSEQDKVLNYANTNYSDITSDPIIYKNLDKAYITFVNDDTTSETQKFANLFIKNNVPLSLAAVNNNFQNYAADGTESILSVVRRVTNAGGEILAHNANPITASTIEDNDTLYNYFVVQKKLLSRYGFNVNGIILAGGNGQIVGDARTAKWASALYSYSDILGEEYKGAYGIDSVYYHYRTAISNYYNDIDKIKQTIDSAIEKKEWKVFYFHNTNEVSLETLQATIDYIKSKGIDNIEMVTYKDMYKKFASRESELKNESTTYYISKNGNGSGLEESDPASLSYIKNRKLKTTDTVLFKSGEIFFDTLKLNVIQVDDEKEKQLTVSTYGGEEPATFSTYKYISDGWEKYSDNIYRIDLQDTSKYTGWITNSGDSANVGFLEDDKGNKYYNKKLTLEDLTENYQFYSDKSQYLYMYLDSNPYKVLGKLKAVGKSNLFYISSNTNVSNLKFEYTGGHGIQGNDEEEDNITISNCIFDNIGGSYLYSYQSSVRYGNGIEFYGSNASNVDIYDNIIRNVYDVGFTIQGTKGSGKNVKVHDNVMITNTQDSEIWESENATGVYGYEYYNNLSINQGRGWGYEARPDKDYSAVILFWGYDRENTDISFTNNTYYNPRKIFYINNTTDAYLLENIDNGLQPIKSNNNRIILQNNVKLYRYSYTIDSRDYLFKLYNFDTDSTWELLESEDNNITIQAAQLENIEKLRALIK